MANVCVCVLFSGLREKKKEPTMSTSIDTIVVALGAVAGGFVGMMVSKYILGMMKMKMTTVGNDGDGDDDKQAHPPPQVAGSGGNDD
jgi:hypothetical protein